MKRRLLAITSSVSLVLLVATVALWVRSYHVWETITWVGPTIDVADQSIAPPEPEVAQTELFLSLVHGNLRLGYDRKVTTRRFATGIGSLLSADERGVHHQATSAEYIYAMRSEPWDPVPKTFMGFSYLQDSRRGTAAFDSGFVVGIPMWTTLVFAVPPMVWIACLLRAKQVVRNDTCANCGYNLTANTSGTCPECGTTIAGNPKVTA